MCCAWMSQGGGVKRPSTRKSSISSPNYCEEDESDCLVNVENFLQQTVEIAAAPTDRWFPPELSVEDVNFYEQLTIGYMAGYIANEILPKIKDCDVCHRNLFHQGEPDEFHHRLVVSI